MVAGIAAAGIGALGSIAGSMLSNAMSVSQSKELAEHQAWLNYKFSKKSAINNPSWNRTGLVKAGYNPMLALSNMQGANSNWTSTTSVNSPDLSNIGLNAVSNALAVKQQLNQDILTNAQSDNYNADTVLKNSQSITELYTQLEKINHADLLAAQKRLTDKDISWYDKKQAREDLRVANEIERTGNDFKVGMAQAIASQISASANQQMSISNAKDVEYRNKNTKEANAIARAGIPPKWATAIGAGLGAGLGTYGAIRSATSNKNLRRNRRR